MGLGQPRSTRNSHASNTTIVLNPILGPHPQKMESLQSTALGTWLRRYSSGRWVGSTGGAAQRLLAANPTNYSRLGSAQLGAEQSLATMFILGEEKEAGRIISISTNGGKSYFFLPSTMTPAAGIQQSLFRDRGLLDREELLPPASPAGTKKRLTPDKAWNAQRDGSRWVGHGNILGKFLPLCRINGEKRRSWRRLATEQKRDPPRQGR